MVIGDPITVTIPESGRATREQVSELTLLLQSRLQSALDEANRLIN
jgi:hypothetical protein